MRNDAVDAMQYLPQLYETDPEPLPEDEPWPKENPYIIMTPELKEAIKNYNAKIERVKEKVTEMVTPIIKAFAEILTPIIEHINEALPSIVKACADVIEDIIDLYPNKRVIYLAKHGKKRVRKKNINRIKKYFERESKKSAVFAP